MNWRERVSAARQADLDFALEASGEGKEDMEWLLANCAQAVDLETFPIQLLLENVELARQTKDRWPGVSDMWRDYVLPWSCLDETRESWRSEMAMMASQIVAATETIEAAVMELNSRIFDVLNVRYSTERAKPNQSIAESRALGKASCTGLSIILVSSCRAVGIPARICGTPRWFDSSGNHTWVEYFDNGKWHFTGAAEQDPAGPDRGWFSGKAEKSSIFAATFRQIGPIHFPLVWDLQSTQVPGINVTESYWPVRKSDSSIIGTLISADHNIAYPDALLDATLTSDEATQARKILWEEHSKKVLLRSEEMALGRVRIGAFELRFQIRMFGERPANGWRVYISLHGGGGAPAQVNDQQWQNQLGLYHNVIPDGSLLVVPRAPTNNWNLWHEPQVDKLLKRLIENLVVFHRINSDNVYLSGYSAGGDGVYKLAPRNADAFAGASMMAGHPNGESLLSLRNVPFSINVGALDGAYDRNKVGREYAAKLETLARNDKRNGYINFCQFPQTGHWMNGIDAQAITWMSNFARASYPTRIVWKQNHDVVKKRFYWLAVPIGVPDSLVIAEHDEKDKQLFRIAESSSTVSELIIRVNEQMVDMDQPISVVRGDQVLFQGLVKRNVRVLVQTLRGRGDPQLWFDGEVAIKL